MEDIWQIHPVGEKGRLIFRSRRCERVTVDGERIPKRSVDAKPKPVGQPAALIRGGVRASHRRAKLSTLDCGQTPLPTSAPAVILPPIGLQCVE